MVHDLRQGGRRLPAKTASLIATRPDELAQFKPVDLSEAEIAAAAVRWSQRFPKVTGPSDPRFWQTVCAHLHEAGDLLKMHMESAQAKTSADAAAVVVAIERLLRAPQTERAPKALRSLALEARNILEKDPLEGDRSAALFALPAYPTTDKKAQLERLSRPVAAFVKADRLRDAVHFSVTFLPMLLPLEIRQLLTHSEVEAKTAEVSARLEELKATRGANRGHKKIDHEDVIRETGRAFGLSPKRAHDWFKPPTRPDREVGLRAGAKRIGLPAERVRVLAESSQLRCANAPGEALRFKISVLEAYVAANTDSQGA